ncbi:MAG: hypothetical protein O7J95_10350 [Planctomycetota bacterium]|nr:hypothetical protein [Planctomycetota bacterium]
MSEVCKLLRSSLMLYAEEELRGGRDFRRVRRHLDRCSSCRARLARYDALTRRILREGSPGCATSGRDGVAADLRAISRRGLILDRIQRQPRPFDPAVRRRWSRTLAAAAAALLVGAALGAFFFPRSTDDVADRGDRALALRPRVPGAAVRHGSGELPPLVRIRWLSQADVEPRRAGLLGARLPDAPVGRTQWFYGVVGEDSVAAGSRWSPHDNRGEEGWRRGEVRWAAELRVVGSTGSSPRFFLVREDFLVLGGDPLGRTGRISRDVVREVVLEQVFEVPSVRLLRGGGVVPPTGYRVIPVMNGGISHPPALLSGDEDLLRRVWKPGAFAARDPRFWLLDDLLSASGPQS